MAWIALAGGAPGVVVSVYLLGASGASQPVYWTLLAVVAVSWLGAVALLRARLSQSLRTISNILMAFREGDYSLRAAKAHRDDPLGEILVELNLFSETLRSGRLQTVEASLLLEQVIASVDVALFAFDERQRLRLINPAGAQLIGRGARDAMGEGAGALGLAACLHAESGAIVALELGPRAGRYTVRKGAFRSDGLPHTFLALSNVSHALRQEEREAWRRLVRVLGHEINNSLSPIKAMAGALRAIVGRDPLPVDWREDLDHALEVIEGRAEALRRFTTGYARLARLPEPRRVAVDVAALVRRAVELETRLEATLIPGPPLTLQADVDQLEQVLINLLRNAADAVLGGEGGAAEARISWRMEGPWAVIEVEDNGPGLLNADNLFVPFFTTKPGGTGIGLALCRQIAEAHGGAISLENRAAARGCVARLRLPL
jgi:two-component system nitrogen regulation sensor histidine kinase NtrY